MKPSLIRCERYTSRLINSATETGDCIEVVKSAGTNTLSVVTVSPDKSRWEICGRLFLCLCALASLGSLIIPDPTSTTPSINLIVVALAVLYLLAQLFTIYRNCGTGSTASNDLSLHSDGTCMINNLHYYLQPGSRDGWLFTILILVGKNGKSRRMILWRDMISPNNYRILRTIVRHCHFDERH